MEATHAMARRRPASFIGMPTQSPSSVLPVLSSSRTGVHSPERSTPRAVVVTSYSCATPRGLVRAIATSPAKTRIERQNRKERKVIPLSEPEPHTELQNARIVRSCDLAERRGRPHDVRLIVLQPVEHVERLRVHFDGLAAAEAELANHRQIDVSPAHALDAVPLHRPLRAERRKLERGGIEEP